MVMQMAKNWWLVAIRGLAAILFGVLATLWPGAALEALVILFGAYALVDGVFALAGGIVAGDAPGDLRLALVLSGLAGAVIGVLTFFWPGVTATVLLSFIIAWSIITGVMQIIVAIRMRQIISNEWLLILGGALSVAFGVFALLYPASGALSIVWAIGFYAIFYGTTLVGFALRLRGMDGTSNPVAQPGG